MLADAISSLSLGSHLQRIYPQWFWPKQIPNKWPRASLSSLGGLGHPWDIPSCAKPAHTWARWVQPSSAGGCSEAQTAGNRESRQDTTRPSLLLFFARSLQHCSHRKPAPSFTRGISHPPPLLNKAAPALLHHPGRSWARSKVKFIPAESAPVASPSALELQAEPAVPPPARGWRGK